MMDLTHPVFSFEGKPFWGLYPFASHFCLEVKMTVEHVPQFWIDLLSLGTFSNSALALRFVRIKEIGIEPMA